MADQRTYKMLLGDIEAGGGGGAGGGVLVATMDAATGTLDKTWQEIDDAAFTVVYVDGSYGGTTSHLRLFVCGTAVTGTEYRVAAYSAEESTLVHFTTTSADDYPIMQQS